MQEKVDIIPLWTGFIPVAPRPYMRIRRGKHGVYNDPRYVKAKKEVSSIMASLFKREALDIPLAVYMTFYMPRPKTVKRQVPSVKPDLDNLEKMYLDAGNGILWRDDALICAKMSMKLYEDETKRIGTDIAIVAMLDQDSPEWAS